MMNRQAGIATGGIALLALIGGVFVATAGNGDTDPLAAVIAPVEPTPTPTPGAKCSTAIVPFVPTSISIPGLPKIKVSALERDANGVPGTPALTKSAKQTMAFDLGSGILIGAKKGNALLNAHTFPDGSALGNTLLDELEEKDMIYVDGPLGRTCYKVTDEVEVPYDNDGKRYYAKTGKPQIAIIVCSGERIGPGQWTKRTIWYASPVA
ncbi:MAG: class F sortase [Sporichthyaceae bacterium]|jgi:hypothetical protein